MEKLRDKLIEGILKKVKGSAVNGHMTQRLPNNVSITFENVDEEALLVMLNEKGICAATGSACTSLRKGPSHVLKAIGKTSERNAAIRFTLGKFTTEDDVLSVLKVVPQIVEKLRH